MNKSKRPMTSNLRKKMSKEVRLAKNDAPSPEECQYRDELTAKEMLKKFPKKPSKKKVGPLEAAKKAIAAKKKKVIKGVSKRTSTGRPPSDSSPASPHREGTRWIKTLTKQNLSERKIQASRGIRKK